MWKTRVSFDESHRLQRQVSELKKEGDQIQRLRQEKDNEIQTMKQKYEEMSATLQNILTVISNLEQPVDKNKIAFWKEITNQVINKEYNSDGLDVQFAHEWLILSTHDAKEISIIMQ
jgi:gas vesicle protein